MLKTILVVLIINIAFYFIYKMRAKHLFAESVINDLNYTQKLLNYNSTLEQILANSKISAKITTEDNKVLFSSNIFKNISTETPLQNNSKIQIDDKCYKVNIYKTQQPKGTQLLNITILSDITDEIKEQNEKETSFALIAHDLKTPIFAVEKALYLINKKQFGSLNENQSKILEMCNSSITFAKYLVNNILTAYKLSIEDISLCITNFDFVELLKNCKDELEFLSKEKEIKIQLNTPEKQSIQGDKFELKRVILNLLYNAIAYSAPKTEIEITLTYDEDSINFTIKNQSTYIPPKDLQKIFRKNISTQNKYSKPGTGLGLYLAKEIIEAHGGEIIAKSRIDNSNTFGFKLKKIFCHQTNYPEKIKT